MSEVCPLQTSPTMYSVDPGWPSHVEGMVVTHQHADGTIHFEAVVMLDPIRATDGPQGS